MNVRTLVTALTLMLPAQFASVHAEPCAGCVFRVAPTPEPVPAPEPAPVDPGMPALTF